MRSHDVFQRQLIDVRCRTISEHYSLFHAKGLTRGATGAVAPFVCTIAATVAPSAPVFACRPRGTLFQSKKDRRLCGSWIKHRRSCSPSEFRFAQNGFVSPYLHSL